MVSIFSILFAVAYIIFQTYKDGIAITKSFLEERERSKKWNLEREGHLRYLADHDYEELYEIAGIPVYWICPNTSQADTIIKKIADKEGWEMSYKIFKWDSPDITKHYK